MAKHFFIPESVEGFHNFYETPISYFTTAVRERLNWTDTTKGVGKLLVRIVNVLMPAYETSYQQYNALLGKDSQHAAWEDLKQKQEALGDAYNELRNALNSNPDHTVEDNDGSHLPPEPSDNPPTPAPIMTDSNPVIDNVVDHAADSFSATFHDSADVEKKHKLPDRQKGGFSYLLTKSSDPLPTRDEVIQSGQFIIAPHSPLHYDFGAEHRGWVLSIVPFWVNTRGQRGRYGELVSIILV